MIFKNNKLNLSILILTILLLVIPSIQSINIDNIKDENNLEIIRIALYDCSSSFNEKQFQTAFNYQWTQNNKLYCFNMTIIDKNDVLGKGPHPLTNENFDVFVIGANAKSYLLDGLDKNWKAIVQNFVANGGGYLGICGGANAASQGFETSENMFHRHVNKGVLGLANVYINDNFLGEWQYLFKIGMDAFFRDNVTNSSYPSYVTVNTTVEKNQGNTIFSAYDENFRYISYAGGPGMYNASLTDQKYGPIIPLLKYNEELMHTKPIHYWMPTLDGWNIFKNISTNLLDKFAGIATTYNSKGRVVLYGPHPEYPFVVINGSIQEYLGHGYLSFYTFSKQYVYNYFGQLLSIFNNIWIVRRSAAWAAHVPDEDLPPISETAIWLNDPIQNSSETNIISRIINMRLFTNIASIIFGNATISSTSSKDVERVEFYVNNNLRFIDKDTPFNWLWDDQNFGKYIIKVIAYDSFGNQAYDEMKVWKIF